MQRTQMATASGQPIVYADPGQTTVRSDDLFTSLSRQCRYNGHCPVTVLQHLALCVELAKLHGVGTSECPCEAHPCACLAYVAAHDMQEAYVSDVVEGLKDCLGGVYEQLEADWERHVHESVGLSWPLSEATERVVRFIDRLALMVEMTAHDFPLQSAVEEATGRAASEYEMDCWERVEDEFDTRLWKRVWNAARGAGDSNA